MSTIYKITLASSLVLFSSSPLAKSLLGAQDNFSNNSNNSFSLVTINNDAPQEDHKAEVNTEIQQQRPDAEAVKSTIQQGYRYAEKGMHEVAIQFYQEALQADPNNPNAHHALGYSLSGLGDYNAAKNAYLKALSIREHPDTLTHLGYNYEKQQDFDSAILAYSNALNKNPSQSYAKLRYDALIRKMDGSVGGSEKHYVDVNTSLKIQEFPFFGAKVIDKLEAGSPVKLIRAFGNSIVLVQHP